MINKPELNEEEIQKNYDEFIKIIEKSFSGERKERLLHMYSNDELGVELAIAPASMMEHWHLAQSGGYLIHIMNVIKNAFGVKKLWKEAGANIDFTDEEMVFSAMHHDLGKLGDNTGSYYKPQDQAWLQKKGEIYRMNPDIQYMDVTDRAVYNLQRYGVKYNWKEYVGLKLADGLYNESNEKYLKSFRPELRLKTNLPHIIHMADFLSCRSEFDTWNNPKEEKLPVVEKE
jgi:hypothetical protein